VVIANALQLEADRRRASRTELFLVKSVLCMHTNCYLPASNQNSDIAIRLSDPDFLEQRNNLTTEQRFHAVTLTFHSAHVPNFTEFKQFA